MWAVDATRQSVSDLFSEASGFPWHPQQGWPLEMLEIRHPNSWYQRRVGQPCGFFSQQHADLDLATVRGLSKDQPQQRVERERVYPKAGALGCNLLPQAPDSSWVFPGPEMAPHNKQPKRKVETQQMTMWKPKYLNLLLFTPQASPQHQGSGTSLTHISTIVLSDREME